MLCTFSFKTTCELKTAIYWTILFERKLTEWLNSLPGGYFNPKQEIRPVPTENESDEVFYGVFAKEPISKGELLNQVPWDYILNDEEDDPSLAEQDESDGSLRCGTARNLAYEMRNVEQSKFGPYIRYLLNQPKGVLPSAWSKKGKDMLQEMLGGAAQKIPPLEATTWLDDDWIQSCHADPSDDIGAHAAMQVVSRADDDLLIPVYDMYNHRNGKWYNTHMKLNRGVNHVVTARRDIEPGEQIHNSYNMCDECGGRRNSYGTPEIFRDYGFVEDFPQRWDLDDFDVMIDLSKDEETSDTLVAFQNKPKDGKDTEAAKRMLRKELKRLYKVRHLLWENEWNNGEPTIPMNEWESLWEYHQAVVDAISYALNALANDETEKVPMNTIDATCSVESCAGDYFDVLDDEPDEIKYNKQTCHNREIMYFPGYYALENLKTHYQVLNFAFRETDGDLCLDLEDTLQICSCYRPHYHEYSAHFAARFVNDVRRIIFIGGGDSMLLHESLKYPNLEKVVGLELDQTVTRKTFKYFRTQPHFDDERVEWWFGDATKSLLLLPKDYWASFDLVLVDLSETVMAFSVTEDLDVFDALALLLKPDGVMVKNELYMDEMSETFDHTLQIFLANNPKICSQTMAFGSNGVDFFHQPVMNQDVETLLLPSVEDLKDRFEYFHDYRRNNAKDDGKCDVGKKEKKEKEQGRSAGILHVVDAENVTVALDSSSLEKLILAAAKEEGFTPVSVPLERPKGTETGVVIVVFQEGYVLARTWGEHKYCALDIGMWGAFVKESSFQKNLVNSLQAKTVSAFRVIVGGMYGSSTWRDDIDTIGPQIVQRPSCDFPEKPEIAFSDTVAIRMLVDETTNLAASKDMVAAVICGVKGQDECVGVDVLEKNARVSKVVTIWTCPNLPLDDEDPDRLVKMFECEKATVSFLKEALGGSETFDYVVLDGSTPLFMGQVMNSILSVPKHRDSILHEFNIFVTWSSKPKTEKWQRNFLERYRKDILYDPITRAELKVEKGDETLEFGLVSSGDLAIFHNLHTLEKKLNKRLDRAGSPSKVEVVKIQGGLHQFNHDYNPREFPHSDYDQAPGDKQYAEQQPLGREAIIQFELNSAKTDAVMPDLGGIKTILEETLLTSKYEVKRSETYTGIGEGALMVSEFKEGSVVLVWDGRHHVDLNLFLFDDRKELADDIASKFSHLSQETLQVGLRDDFPRGLGRVVNFHEDLVYQGLETFTERRPYVED
ncbi:spermine/spermidine synthase domain containing protein [Nitzschia inconspicua]|uniref:Spermine synthase n=1 Tax=Nitzschia inconspicua TaxID=303405 RepID=A0A9K3KAD8_9STRA|nr:spermine synthase [Nitzschia inconspicua]KAG7362417.1 spermine/spermidine synthase domain containing protein [Nitzschia inconspicua]